MTKSRIIERLGEEAVLLPDLIAAALAANDRAKLRLTLLQDLATHAADGTRSPLPHGPELAVPGLSHAELQPLIAGARALGQGRFSAPGLQAQVQGLRADLDVMLAPLSAAGAPEHPPLAARLAALAGGIAAEGDALDLAQVSRFTSARPGGDDSVHLLVMALHRAINRVAAETAVEDVDGAKTHHLDERDRRLVAAFMRGVRRTAPLAFGHPGLGTTAARAGGRLTIQNDIGETDAHVLVVHVEEAAVTVTYTDVHRRRARFFMDLLGEMSWSALAEQHAADLGGGAAFYLVSGRFEGADDGVLEGFLERLGARIVFLIDWNKGRKALQAFVDRDVAIAILGWAARQELGHRAFLESGGADFVLEIIRRAAAGRVPYGVRLDAALGPASAEAFLQRVLQETSEGLQGGRSARLVRDDLQTDLSRRLESGQSEVLSILVRHLGLSRTLAGLLVLALCEPDSPERTNLADRAKRMEAKADQLTLEAREAGQRLNQAQVLRRLIDRVEDAMDALDECAFLVTLPPDLSPYRGPLSRLAEIAVGSVADMVRATETAGRLHEGRREDALAALKAIDAVSLAEREADVAERAAIAAAMGVTAPDSRAPTLALEIARSLESATDHLSHAALTLRERILEEQWR